MSEMSVAAGIGIAGGLCHCYHDGLNLCDDVSGQTSGHIPTAAFLYFHSFATANYLGTC